jgi:hypothetical protein
MNIFSPYYGLYNRTEYVNIVCNLCKLLFITEDTIKYSLDFYIIAA